ncbi:PREDICTED: serine protease 27-like [Nanorana parkeri]|uniref:serine protease 27-like n=1 Tax=Nanorana parkeri TaxID=125878 RepID=UPI000854BF72|nr:PREDICTED: serine protease 27-like [Nanorana parkeri]
MHQILLLVMMLLHGAHGRIIMQDRIVGGQDTKVAEWPWQISLQKDGLHLCGGSLLSESWVLLVAHCFEMPLDLSTFTVYLGVYQLSELSSLNAVKRGVKRVITHPDFTEEGSSADIALMELDKPVSFTSFISPVFLSSQNVSLPEGTMCSAIGWGDIHEEVNLPEPKTLQKVDVALIDSKKCEAMYRGSLGYGSSYNLIEKDMICAGYKQGGKDSCQGDSGGPLMCNVKGVWLQFAINSWGYGCARQGCPGVYTRVQNYQSWLLQYVPNIRYSDGGKSSPSVNATSTASNSLSLAISLKGQLGGKMENSTFNATGIKLASAATSSHVFSMTGIILILFPLLFFA